MPMAAPSKAQYLNVIHTTLKKRYKPKPDRLDGRLSVLEAVIYGICHEGTTREQANQALSRFKDGFFDWNEVRVSSVEEIQHALIGFPAAEPRAQKIRRFLRQLFEKTYSFTLDALVKKPLKESLKVLAEYDAFGSDYVEATVVQLALGGHAIPVDEPCRRALVRLGIADAEVEPEALRSLLERAVPKNRGIEFSELIEELAHDTCVEGPPDCPRCDLRKTCPTAAALKEETASSVRQAAASARAAAKDKKAREKGPPKGAAAPSRPSTPAKSASKSPTKRKVAPRPPLKNAKRRPGRPK